MCKHIFANVIFCIILLNVQSMKIRGRTSSLTANEKTKSFPENAVIKIEPSEKSISLCKGDDCQKLDDFETKNKREEQKEKATTNMNFLKEKIQEEKMKNAEFCCSSSKCDQIKKKKIVQLSDWDVDFGNLLIKKIFSV